MNKFYYNKKPFLTKEEEISLAKRIEKGDKEAFKILIESNLGLVLKIANERKFKQYSKEDIIQEGNIGLMKAARYFDWRKGFRFSGFAYKVIYSKIYEWVRNNKKLKKQISLESPIYENGNGEKISLIKSLENKEDESQDRIFEKIELKDYFNKAFNCLSKKEKDIIKLRFGIDDGVRETLENIGKLYGISKQRVQQLEIKALFKLGREVRKNRKYKLGE